MKWQLKYSDDAERQLRKIDPIWAKRIRGYMDNQVLTAAHPKDLGKALTGDLPGHYRYRIGDYRVICELHEEVLLVWVVEAGHRKNIY